MIQVRKIIKIVNLKDILNKNNIFDKDEERGENAPNLEYELFFIVNSVPKYTH